MAGLALLVVVGLRVPSAAAPDPQPSNLAFEVASVRLNVSGAQESSFVIRQGPALVTNNYELRWLLARAYGINAPLAPHILIGGAKDVLSARFDIEARGPEDTQEGDVPEMLRNLLVERFGLRIRSETRETPVYVVTILRDGALGPELRSSAHDCAALFAEFQARGQSPSDGIASPRDAKGRPVCWFRQADDPSPRGAWRSRYAGPLARLLSGAQGWVDRPIVDETGLSGHFEWQLVFSLPGVPASDFPSIYAAFEEQLGLTLEPRQRMLEVLVIDSVELPEPN